MHQFSINRSTNFSLLSVVNFNPSIASGIQSATRVMLTSSNGVLAANVAAVKFDFTSPASENGYCGYAAINVFGTPSLEPAASAALLNATFLLPDEFVMNIGNLSVGRNYALQSTTNLSSAFWSTETNFVAATASVAISNTTDAASQKFYRIVGN